ncbi:MAG: glycosyltransferase [Candidatus Lokiarchaeota archaeon]|nr:glycosyltransferase [Candidatus Lokiarchaeota archaeon]
MKKVVSIILLNYNNTKYTIDCIKSLLNQTYSEFEVIIVDNGSDYRYYKKLVNDLEDFNERLDIKVLRAPYNLYFAGGNNKGIKNAKGIFYVC